MTSYLAGMIDSLNSLQWDNLSVTFQQVEGVLRDVDLHRDQLRADLETTGMAELQRRADLSHETTTHYKWYLHKEQTLGYSIWLHEYKPESLRRPGYAEVPHDHRYWFSSLILSGGFMHHIYHFELPEQGDMCSNITEIETHFRGSSMVYTVSPEMVHSLSNIDEPTLTLLIRSKAVKPYSESYDLGTRRITRYIPFSSRIENIKEVTRLI